MRSHWMALLKSILQIMKIKRPTICGWKHDKSWTTSEPPINQHSQDHFQNSITYFNRALAIFETKPKVFVNNYINVLSDLGWSYNRLAKTATAEEYMRKALQASKDFVGEETLAVISALQDL